MDKENNKLAEVLQIFCNTRMNLKNQKYYLREKQIPYLRGKKQAETMESVFHSHVKTEKALLSIKRKYEIQASSKVRAENSCIHSKRNNNEISPNDIFGNQI